MATMKTFDIIAWILCTIAALDLGIIGLTNYDVLALLGGATRAFYLLLGIGGIYSASHIFMKKK
ncbi:MAG: DUF378 domain-containing protein [Nanoarchaeota archaeon]